MVKSTSEKPGIPANSLISKYQTRIKAGKGTVDLVDIQGGLIKALQARAGIKKETVDDYSALMRGGKGPGNAAEEFPPLRIWQVKDTLYLTSGGHRWRAAKQAQKEVIDAEFFTGTYVEALVDAITSNAKHGLRPTREDIRYSLGMLFGHAEYRKASDNKLAKLVGCSPTTVGTVRKELEAGDDGKRVGADGREQNTKRIGKGKKAKLPKSPLSKLDSEPDDDEPCHACWVRKPVDGVRCKRCIDEDRPILAEEPPDSVDDDDDDDEAGEPAYADHLVAPEDGDRPEVIDDAEEDDSDAADMMRAWNKAIESVARYLGKLDEGLAVLGKSPWFDAERRGRVETRIAAAVDELRAVKGYKVCPQCSGADGGCKYCLKTGYVTRVVYDSLEAGA